MVVDNGSMSIIIVRRLFFKKESLCFTDRRILSGIMDDKETAVW